MKKLLPTLALLAMPLALFAEAGDYNKLIEHSHKDSSQPRYDGIVPLAEESFVLEDDASNRPEYFSLSLNAGYYGNFGGDLDGILEDTAGIDAEFLLRIPETPLSLVFRTQYTNPEFEEGYIYYGYYDSLYLEGGNWTKYNFSAELRLDLELTDWFALYISGGVLYTENQIEMDIRERSSYRSFWGYRHNTYYYYTYEESVDDVLPIGHIGATFENRYLFLNAEVGVTPKRYEYESAFVDFRSVVGIKPTQNMRLSVVGTYTTEVEDYFIGGGITFQY